MFSFFLSLLLAGTVLAQESESEGMKRILNPPLNPASDLQVKSFYGGADQGFSTKTGNVKSFQWTDLFRLKTYTGSKKYGAKDYWTGNYESGTNKVLTKGNYSIPNAGTLFATTDKPTRTDRDAGKTQEVTDYDKNRPYLIPGKSQKIINSQEEEKKPLTVDEVRKILNTTR